MELITGSSKKMNLPRKIMVRDQKFEREHRDKANIRGKDENFFLIQRDF